MLRHCAYIVTFVPSVLRWRLAETKPGARRTEPSVASVRSSTSRRWFAGSTVNTLIRVITSLFAEIVVIVSLPSEKVEIRSELRYCRAPAAGWKRSASAGWTAAANGVVIDTLGHCLIFRVYLTGVVSSLSSVSTTKTASSFAGLALLALRLMGWLAPGGSDQLSPAL